jgi:hypothetical protein
MQMQITSKKTANNEAIPVHTVYSVRQGYFLHSVVPFNLLSVRAHTRFLLIVGNRFFKIITRQRVLKLFYISLEAFYFKPKATRRTFL